MLNWLNTSITRKISSLSTILLSFLFLVIVYSIYKLQQINLEMREIAEIDIPLTSIIREIEFLRLKQHLLIERIHLKVVLPAINAINPEYVTEFNGYSQELAETMDEAFSIIQSTLSKSRVRLQITEYQAAINSLTELQQTWLRFEQTFQTLLSTPLQIKESDWESFEQQNRIMDDKASKLVLDLERFTQEAARYAEKHEYEFMLVNVALGISALFIGFYLSIYIIQSFRKRVSRMQGQLEMLQHSITHKIPFEPEHWKESQSSDELAELEKDLKTMMGNLSKEIHNRYAVEQQLIELATRDKLTGTFNRHKWDEQLQIELNLASRGSLLSLLLIDIDHFKRINDNYGHDIGDKALQTLAVLLKQRLRETDLLFRLGGEEFTVLLRHIDVQNAVIVAEALRTQVETAVIPGIPQFTISIGVCTYIANDNTDDMMKRADLALYKAKNQGRNRVQVV